MTASRLQAPPRPAAVGRLQLVVALAGNANVGKSAIYNQLTGLEQAIGNYPGTTVEVAEGYLEHHGRQIKIVDLPGTYSLSSRSADEIVTRDFVLAGKADVVIDVVDATALERSLFLTLQLLETGVPMVIALNLVDLAQANGIAVDPDRLAAALHVPVLPTVAVHGTGVHALVDAALAVAGTGPDRRPEIRFAPEVEERVQQLSSLVSTAGLAYPSRWVAAKLLEGDQLLERLIENALPGTSQTARALAEECARARQQPRSMVMASERYAAAGRIAAQAQTFAPPAGPSTPARLDAASMHPIWGYAIMLGGMLSILAVLSTAGGWLAQAVQDLFEAVNPGLSGFWPELLWNGGVVGLYAALGVALGFLLPFYLILSALENSGYLPRLAFLMDRPCHAIGLHGKAILPMITALGCNVPACVGCRIIETRRDRLIATFLSTLVPCSARTAVILGIVGAYMGAHWAALVYLIEFGLAIGLGRLLSRLSRSSAAGMIMEIPPYRPPVARLVVKQAWARFRPFVTTAVPLIVAGSLAIEFLRLVHALDELTAAMAPVTVWWLGLPAFTGVLFILGLLRKEAAVTLLGTVAGTMHIPQVMTPVQMFVFTLTIALYIPCIATIGALVKEVGWRLATAISAGEVLLAVAVGGVCYRVLTALGV